MRELRFRAWGKNIKEYLSQDGIEPYVYTLKDISDGSIYDIDNFIIEQSACLKDKNGKEIYEGDIVENIEGVNEIAVCIWDESNAEFDFVCVDGKCTRDNVKSWLEMYEVVGNIHEDSELLGEKE